MNEAEYFVREAQWADAIPVLKQCLLINPRNAGAHFYLGRCWLNVKQLNDREGPWLIPAEGELALAIRLFKDQGGKSPIDRFDDNYFELICHLEKAKIYLRQFNFIVENGYLIEGATIEAIMVKCRQELDEARKIDPNSNDVKMLEDILSPFEARPPRAPSRVTLPTASSQFSVI